MAATGSLPEGTPGSHVPSGAAPIQAQRPVRGRAETRGPRFRGDDIVGMEGLGSLLPARGEGGPWVRDAAAKTVAPPPLEGRVGVGVLRDPYAPHCGWGLYPHPRSLPSRGREASRAAGGFRAGHDGPRVEPGVTGVGEFAPEVPSPLDLGDVAAPAGTGPRHSRCHSTISLVASSTCSATGANHSPRPPPAKPLTLALSRRGEGTGPVGGARTEWRPLCRVPALPQFSDHPSSDLPASAGASGAQLGCARRRISGRLRRRRPA